MIFYNSKSTLAIYGIKDIKKYGFPVFVSDHNKSFFINDELKKLYN